MTSSLLPLLPAVDDILFDFAQSDGFWANLVTAFGTSYDVVKATQLPLRETEKTGFFEKPVGSSGFCVETRSILIVYLTKYS